MNLCIHGVLFETLQRLQRSSKAHTMQAQHRDITTLIESLLKQIMLSLDQSYYESPQKYSNNIQLFKSSILPQLHNRCAIIINGTPFGESSQFKEHWSNLPGTQHNLLSFDTHLIPNTQTSIVISHLKVRFDESGRSRLGETSDLIDELVSAPAGNRVAARHIWGNWFGVCLTFVVDEQMFSHANNNNNPCITSFNYRFTEQPESSVFTI